jgi:hypothetical protein
MYGNPPKCLPKLGLGTSSSAWGHSLFTVIGCGHIGYSLSP